MGYIVIVSPFVRVWRRAIWEATRRLMAFLADPLYSFVLSRRRIL